MRAIFFIIFFYLLVKVISKYFLQSGSKKKSKARAFYDIYNNVRNNGSSKHKNGSNSNSQKDFDELEEAEYEDVTEDDNARTKSSD